MYIKHINILTGHTGVPRLFFISFLQKLYSHIVLGKYFA